MLTFELFIVNFVIFRLTNNGIVNLLIVLDNLIHKFAQTTVIVLASC